MTTATYNKYRAAVEVLQKGRELVVEGIADDILDQGEDLLEGGYQLNEFLENQGTRLHFLTLLIQQLEQSAEEAAPKPEPEPEPEPVAKAKPKPRKSRSKKMTQAAAEGKAEDA